MAVFAGQGDPRRTMALLSRDTGTASGRPGRGPKPGLSVDLIVDTAIEIADAEGLAALSMRAVGGRLGRTAMALYTYVPSKGELVDLMYDKAFAELAGDYSPGHGWRRAITDWAEDLWRFLLRHPWVLQVSQARPVLGPHEYLVLEHAMRLLSASGLRGPRLRQATSALFSLVRGAAQTVADTRHAFAATWVSEDDWWNARSAMLHEVAPDFAERFPTLSRLAEEGTYDLADESAPYLERAARESLEFGLRALLDGIETATRGSAGRPPTGTEVSGPGR
ncbi:TetR/AcrR family transcriptional regulator [Prauserella oleivorans]|uniref:TetR/AcrR family transcriptional regulator n=1 Tax=Prauserella oleivorans TaxID=1478153 RepID=A0ABW5WAY8_9PSEU